jgi:Flp pilus assembly protein TadG
MGTTSSLTRRFARDERGVFAVIFGLTAIVLVALAGAVVDFVSLQQSRTTTQVALDAAALALQPRILEPSYNVAEIQTLAQNLVNERLAASGRDDITAVVDTPIIDVANGSLLLEASIQSPTIFVALVGVNRLDARLRSEATRRALALEVAMVLDNSGSMANESRMTNLKSAATCATNILLFDAVDASCNPTAGAAAAEDTRIALVPFTMFVNVGNGNANASWIDRTGASPLHNDNFDNDGDEDTLPSSTPNRFDLFTATGQAWRGCVEARPHRPTSGSTGFLDTDDTVPVSGDTLFVPLFSPDMTRGFANNYLSDGTEVDNNGNPTPLAYPASCDRPSNSSAQCTQTQLRTTCNSSMNNIGCTTQNAGAGSPSGNINFNSNTIYSGARYGAHSDSCSCRTFSSWSGWTRAPGSPTSGNNQTWQRTRNCSGGGYIPMGLSAREAQERVCKYYQPSNASNFTFSFGPNADCTRTAILPLTDNAVTVRSTIAGMTAEGGTNIHEGTVWGLRVLSPTEPFTQGAVYNEATAKFMIVMTDGENTAYNLSNHCGNTQRALTGNCYNSAYGFPYNSANSSTTSTSGGNVLRMGAFSPPVATGGVGTANATLVTQMNERLLQTCTNAKAAGITIYTIGLATDTVSQSTQQVVEDMLLACSSGPEYAYLPESPSDLTQVFRDIAGQLAQLRLAQ